MSSYPQSPKREDQNRIFIELEKERRQPPLSPLRSLPTPLAHLKSSSNRLQLDDFNEESLADSEHEELSHQLSSKHPNFDDEVASLQAQLEKYIEECSSFELQIQTLTLENNDLKSRLSSFEDLDRKANRVNSLQSLVDGFKVKLGSLQVENNQVKEENRQLNHQLELIPELKSKLLELEKENRTFVGKCAEGAQRNRELKELMEDYQQLNIKLETENSELKSEISENQLETENSELKSEISKLTQNYSIASDFEQKCQQLETENSELKSEISKLTQNYSIASDFEQKCQQLETENSELKSEISKLTQNYSIASDFEQKCQQLETENSELKSEISKLTQNYSIASDFEQKCQQLETENSDLKSEISKLTQNYSIASDFEQKCQQLETENSELKSEISKLTENYSIASDFEQKCQQLETENSELKSEISENVELLEGIKIENAELKSEISKLKANFSDDAHYRVCALEVEIDSLKSAVSNKDASIEQLLNNEVVLNSKIADLNAANENIEKLYTDILEKSTDNSSLQLDLSKLRQEKDEFLVEIEEAKTALSQLTTEKQSLLQEFQSAFEECEKLRLDKQSLEDDIISKDDLNSHLQSRFQNLLTQYEEQMESLGKEKAAKTVKEKELKQLRSSVIAFKKDFDSLSSRFRAATDYAKGLETLINEQLVTKTK
ncbi:hypothetical protein P9112_013027 [Eukaryota sp. TZLM1-RC]